jgi:hypothetical protein
VPLLEQISPLILTTFLNTIIIARGVVVSFGLRSDLARGVVELFLIFFNIIYIVRNILEFEPLNSI